MLEPPAHHALRGRVLKLELSGQVGVRSHLGRRSRGSFQPRTNAGVSQLRAVAHQRAVSFAIGCCSRRIHRVLNDDRDTVLIFVQRLVMPSESAAGSMGNTTTPV